MVIRAVNRIFVAICFSIAFLLSGCASTPTEYRDPRDPWEPYNRSVTKFNDSFDETVYKPVARAYRTVTPEFVDLGVSNFFANQLDIMSALNNVLQLKLEDAATDIGRVVINSTVGLLGLIDWASDLDFPKHREDFGQTLGYWGVVPGPYFVWPIIGPRTVRDSFGLVVDWYSTPVAYLDSRAWRWGLAILYGVDVRADLLSAGEVLKQAALDPYVFTRDAYLQKRRYDIYDGNPPPDDTEPSDDELEELFQGEIVPAQPE